MWDSNSPLQLLNTMPKKLTKENLQRLQLVIDADKYKNSLLSGFDLCGMYAPFCRGCKKTSIYPCAVAYINMLKAGGMDIEIDARPVEAVEEVQEEVAAAAEPEVIVAAEVKPEPLPTEVKPAEVRAEAPVKRKIRIAVARRKI
ncbi:MAG: hypothetical protein HFK06_02780 [Clostridia bacterium]|nr:hypothetical protein [Clostridia bacterium]